MSEPILTDAEGRPIPGRPEPLKPGASFKEWRDWVRAERAWKDRATDTANRAFTEGFREGLKK